jgi:hypothetical protein
MTARKKAEELAKRIIVDTVPHSMTSSHEHMDWLCNLSEAIVNHLEEIEAARKLLHVGDQGVEMIFHAGASESYAAIRKRNEGEETE